MPRLRGLSAVLLALLLTALVVLPAGPAAAVRGPIRPSFFGVQDDRRINASASFGASRVMAYWCSMQPTAGTNVQKKASASLRRVFELNRLAKRERLAVTLGHPAPWVYGNNKRAWRGANIWYCGRHRSALTFPSPASLRAGPVRKAYAAYVTAVVTAAKPYLAGKGNRLVLQAWNEPNLSSGGRVNLKIPGSARTWTQAAESLREQERIMRKVAQRLIPGRYEISTPAMYGKHKPLTTAYFRLQAKSRTVDSISVNFYTMPKLKSINISLARWRAKAQRALRAVASRKALRGLPIWIAETNHNLVNRKGNHSNRKAMWTSPAAQRRLVEVTTMEAIRMGFQGIEWYQGNDGVQTGVNTRPGTTASLATKRLRDQLVGRTLTSCRTKGSTSTCGFTARKGSGPIHVTWSRKGSAGVSITR